MLKRYRLPSVKGGGWAFIVIDTEIGYFSTVSDYGNYAYIWTAPGEDFRKFLIGLSVDYLRGKLLHGRDRTDVFDGYATKIEVEKAIEEYNQQEFKRTGQNWEHYDQEHELCRDIDSEREFDEWVGETNLDDACELARFQPDPQCTGFCEKVYPRFVAMLKAELAEEQKVAS
jgi:hypothetical protein